MPQQVDIGDAISRSMGHRRIAYESMGLTDQATGLVPLVIQRIIADLLGVTDENPGDPEGGGCQRKVKYRRLGRSKR